ncbi:hypothetical protein Hanom_Chr04g00315391 [Helianthus anomalus]
MVSVLFISKNKYLNFQKMLILHIKIRVKCHFSPCGLDHFTSLVQMFHLSYVVPKRFHRCHFSPLR